MASKEYQQALAENVLLAGKYQIIRKLGSGSFGDIYLAVNTCTGEEVAIKMEKSTCQNALLCNESEVYELLQGGIGVPRVQRYAQEQRSNLLVMDLLGPCLEDLFNFCSRRFTLKTILMIADQLIQRLQFIHSRGFIHRDIKPDNLLMGLGRHSSKVYMVDFGLAKRYRDAQTGQHIAYTEDRPLTGTARYASINALMGAEQSRRDDMESLGYVLLYFCRGSLPWQGLRGATKEQQYNMIGEIKLSTPVEALCKGFPAEFSLYLNYCRELGFAQEPDYDFLRRLFRILFKALDYQYDYVYDWTIIQRHCAQRRLESVAPRKNGDLGHCHNKTRPHFSS